MRRLVRFLGGELARIGRNAVWSWNGWRAAWASEKSLRQWTLANAISAAAAFLLPLGTTERALIVGLGLLVLVAELLNTAIEEAVDYISTEEHPRAGKAKDAASAAVALAAIGAGIVWVIVLSGLFFGT